MNTEPSNETPLMYLLSRARDNGHKELADKAERMSELLAKVAGELTALGYDPNESGGLLYLIHNELGYT